MERGKLTTHNVGSVKELWAISYPMMLAALSTYGMIFGDRWILSKYDLCAMNSVGVVSVMVGVFEFSLLSLAMISEVFVGQYNGKGRLKDIGAPVWQMIWFCTWMIIPFAAIGSFFWDWFVHTDHCHHGGPYFRWMILFSPVCGLSGALCGFFIGRGKTLVVTLVMFLGNMLNLGLDLIFVFGIKDVLEPMGTAGAAIATGIALIVQVLILGALFLKKENRLEFGTNNYKLNLPLLKECLAVGAPNAISHGIAILAWAFFFRIVAEAGSAYLTALIVTQNYFFVFCIIHEGLGKGVTAICANLMGAERYIDVKQVLKSAFKLLGIFTGIMAVPLLVFADISAGIFLGEAGSISSELLVLTREGLFWMWILFMLNGTFWIFLGQLTAAGDVYYTMIMNILSAWIFLLIPAYLAIKVFDYPANNCFKIMALDMLAISICFILRYRSGKWKTKVIN